MRNLILALAGMAVSGLAVAGPSWTYADIGYVRADSGDDETDAFEIEGSFGFADKYHIQASYADGENGDVGNGEDFDGYEIRAGINPAVTDNTDFVFQVGYFDVSQETPSDDDVDVDGYILSVGMRSMFTDQVELSAFVDSVTGEVDSDACGAAAVAGCPAEDGDDITDIILRVGGQYFFTDNLSLNIEYEDGDDSSARFGVRWSF